LLREAGFSVRLTDVVCVNMPDRPGALHEVLKILADNAINVDYMYAFSNKEVALAVIRAADIGQVVDVLEKNEMELLRQSDIYQV